MSLLKELWDFRIAAANKRFAPNGAWSPRLIYETHQDNLLGKELSCDRHFQPVPGNREVRR